MRLLRKRLTWRVGRKLYCSARGEQRSAAIEFNGEADIQAKVLAAIPIDVPLQAIDIGANQGEWASSLLSQASPERRTSARLRIDAFEPFPATADRFEQQLSRVPGRETVHLHRLAISDSAGAERLAVTSATGGTNTLHYDQTAGDPSGGWCEVRLDTLDAFCASSGIGHIHLAKCDTEGHDAKVLKGALGLLSAGRIDVFQFEYNHRWVHARAFLKDVFDLVHGLPYRVAKVRQAGVIDVYPTWHPELDRFFESNYLLVREPALSWFAANFGGFDVSNTYA
ncbi:MAG: FkbM family methyltransferase [Rhodomicrobium sp.]